MGQEGAIPMGRWQFDPETVTLFDDKSGQRLRFDGVLPDWPSWLFRYSDPEIEYPIVVSGWPDQFRPGQGNTWTIDHRDSAARWRADSGLRWPPYGQWRRVELAVSDALLCWPQCEATGPVPWKIVSLGGWFNGQWSRRIVRSRGRDKNSTFEPGGPDTAPSEALNAQPHSWHYVDVSPVGPGAELLGIQEYRRGQLYYPLSRKPEGFQHAVPHLLRGDGHAAIFPAGMSSYMYRFETYRPGAYFVYIDEDVFFRFGAAEFGGTWEFELRYLKLVGLRVLSRFMQPPDEGLPPSLFREVGIGESWVPGVHPSHRLWQTVSEALIDGGLSWTGNPGRLLDDPVHLKAMAEPEGDPPPALEESGISLGRKSRVTIGGGYVGGRFNRIFETEAWLEPET